MVHTPAPEDPRYQRRAGWLLVAWRGLRERDLEIAVRAAAGQRFEVVLIGRDGGEKLRSAAPVPPAELFARIDTMPMWRAEMAGEAGHWRPESGRKKSRPGKGRLESGFADRIRART